MELTHLRLEQVDLVLDQPILNQLSVSFKPGIHCLLGPNGAGKTMTNRLVGLITEVSQGRIYWDDNIVNPFTENRLDYIRSIGYMRQQPVFLSKNVFANIALPLQFREIEETEIDERVYAIITEFELEELADRHITKLSKGQQQRVALARTIIADPSIIILDEPSASLDMATTKWFEQYIQSLPDEKLIIWTTHDQFQVRRVADQVSVIIDGQLLSSGSTSQILEHASDERVRRYLSGELI